MDPARPIMWNIPEWAEITLYALIPVVLIAFAAGVAWRVRKWFLGRPEPGVESVRREILRGLQPRRLLEWVKIAFFQSRLSSDGYSLVMHLAIFWGMLVLAVGTALATIDQDFANLLLDAQVLRAGVYRVFELALDMFGVVLILGLGMAGFRRYVLRPKRLAATCAVSLWDGFPFLTFLFLIAVTGFEIEGLRLAEGFQLDSRVALAQGPEAKAQVIEHSGIRAAAHGPPAPGRRDRAHRGGEPGLSRGEVGAGRLRHGQARRVAGHRHDPPLAPASPGGCTR